MNHFIDLATKVGGLLAIVGLFVGAWLWYPSCETTFGVEECRNFWGEVSVDQFGSPATKRLVMTGGAIGAGIGAVAGLVIALIWPHTKKDLGME